MRHEKTLIYQKCLELMQIAQDVIEKLPRGMAFLADQLRRSTSSVTRNFAEGFYQRSIRQKSRYFEYSIQSARESSSSFDSAICFKAAELATAQRGKNVSLELVKMISKYGPTKIQCIYKER
jgi:four helix bundle protein